MHPTEFGKQMNVEDLVAVHLTKYFPTERTIQTLNSNFPEFTLRNTVHFAINHPVGSIGFYGNWDSASYAVLTPLSKLCQEPGNQVWNFNVVDTYFVGDTKIPKNSTIIVSSHGYQELIQQGVVDKETIMAKFQDERCPPKPEDKLVIEKEGIKYILLSWNAENLRTETDQEIQRQGYHCMPAGQWNWGSEGASHQDQQRIAQQIGTKTGRHCDDELKEIEELSHELINMRTGIYIRPYIDAYLEARKRGLPKDIDELEPDAQLGMQRLRAGSDFYFHLPNLLRQFEKEKANLPTDYKRRIDRFLELNRSQFRTFIPSDVIKEFALPL